MRRYKQNIEAIIVVILICFAPLATIAGTWTGGGNGIWDSTDEATDWSGTPPAAGSQPAVLTGAVTVPVDGSVGALYMIIGNSAKLQIGDGDTVTSSGGDLLIATDIAGGGGPTGIIEQTGGTFIKPSNLFVLGHNQSGGLYDISGGVMTSAVEIAVGYSSGSSGHLKVTGTGEVRLSSHFRLPKDVGATAELTLSETGSIAITSGGQSFFGNGVSANINLSGGDFSFTSDSYLLFYSGATVNVEVTDSGIGTLATSGQLGQQAGGNGATLNININETSLSLPAYYRLIDSTGVAAGWSDKFANAATSGSVIKDSDGYLVKVHYGAHAAIPGSGSGDVILEIREKTDVAEGTILGIDMGNEINATNWNICAGSTTLAANSVVDTSGTVLSGVSITVVNGNAAGNISPGWVEDPAGSLPDVPDSATRDIVWANGWDTILVTVAGLPTDLDFLVYAVTSANSAGRTETVTVTGNSTATSTLIRNTESYAGKYHKIKMPPNGSGTITIEVSESVAGNPILNMIRIKAIVESTLFKFK